MQIKRFEDIKAWQKARELTLLTYELFKDSRDFKFRDQIQSASVSIMNNIAEGFERSGNVELRRFLYISKGSCAEVRSMLYLALDLKSINAKDFEKTYGLSLEISKMLSGFIKTL
ncbi:MAG: four helix bundle protein [Patescibacteria group bacterium]